MSKLNQSYAIMIACIALLIASNAVAGTNSFENYKTGVFSSLSNDDGSLTVTNGKAEITSAYSKTGSKCLHIFGGTDTTVEFTPPASSNENFLLTFWAERWTHAKPFKFRVEANMNSAWKEIYNGDRTIKLGSRFLSYVEIDIQKFQASKYRFVVSAPVSAGVIIDDISLQPKKAMEIKNLTTIQRQTPVLIRNEINTILGIEIETDGTMEPSKLTGIKISTNGTDDLADIESFSVYSADAKDAIGIKNALVNKDDLFGASQKPAKGLTFKGSKALGYGKKLFLGVMQN